MKTFFIRFYASDIGSAAYMAAQIAKFTRGKVVMLDEDSKEYLVDANARIEMDAGWLSELEDRAKPSRKNKK